MHLLKRTVGSRRGLVMNLLLPSLVLSAIAGVLSGKTDNKPIIAVSNQDNGILGSYIVDYLRNNDHYEIKLETAAAETQLKDSVENNEANASVYIPADFSESLMSGRQQQVSMYRIGENLWSASLGTELAGETDKLASAVGLIDGKTDDQAVLAALLDKQHEGIASVRETELKLGSVISRPEVIGIMLMFVMMLSSQSIGYILEDREKRTLARMYVAPVRAADIAWGNFTGSILIGTLQLVIVLSVTHFGFGFMESVPFGSLLLVMECFLLAAVGMMMLVAGLVKRSEQLGTLNFLFIIPTCMISGCFWPFSIMPDFMQKLSNFTPQKWAIQAIDRLSAGEHIADITMQLGVLLLLAAVLTAFGAAVLRPMRTAQ
nr:ABC transporter permease [Paenibacillus sp. NEAU-GSW1]